MLTCITVSFSSAFVSGAEIGALVEGRVDVTKKTGSMVFLTGSLFVSDETILTFTAVVKRLRN